MTGFPTHLSSSIPGPKVRIFRGMTDTFEAEKRSQIMALVKSRNTKPEIIVRQLVHQLGFRFQLKTYPLPGNPDIVLPRYKIAIFVHGCFWHQHQECRGRRIPKSRLDYWQPKLQRNVERDKGNLQQLKASGWKAIVVWECSLKDLECARKNLQSNLPKRLN